MSCGICNHPEKDAESLLLVPAEEEGCGLYETAQEAWGVDKQGFFPKL